MIQLSEIAEMVRGQLVGDDQVCVGANPPKMAVPGEITMLSDPAKLDMISGTRASAIVVREPIEWGKPQIIVDDPHQAFSDIVSKFRPPITPALPPEGVASSAVVADSAEIHESVVIGPGTVIGQRTLIMPGVVILPNCKIGDDCLVMPNVTLYPYTKIENRVIIHAGCVIGADGFGYQQRDGRHVKSAQLGYVHIHDDVELGAAVTIDRGAYGATTIGEGTKVDNQVMIGHNCQIGKHNLLCSQVGIAGSSTTGDYVIMAGQAGVKDHVHIGDNAIIGAQAGVMHDCQPGVFYLGSPAMPQRERMQIVAASRRLPEMRREIKKLRAELDEMKSRTNPNLDSDQRAA